MKLTESIKKNRLLIFLILLSLIGFAVRFILQPTIPYGFHRDEAGIAYSAYSILKTSKDEWGRMLPLHFKALGDYPPGIYNYLVVLALPFLGLTELAERFPAILIGTLLIPISYLFIKTYFKNSFVAFITAVLVTFSPWMVTQSRAGSEALTALFFSILGFLMFEKWVRKKQLATLLSVSIFYFLALFSYNAARVVLPLMHIALISFFWKEIPKEEKLKHIYFTVAVFVVAIGSIFITSGNQMSFNNNSLLTNTKSSQQLEVIFNREGMTKIPITFSRIYTNKVSNFLLGFSNQYIDYFDVNFLFNDAGFHKRYMVPDVGPLLLVQFPLLIIGIFKGRISKRQKIFLVLWILFAPLGGSVTSIEVPNIKRAMYLFFPLLILAAYGVEYLYLTIRQHTKGPALAYLALILISSLYVLNIGYFAKQYVAHSRFETTRHRSYGYKEAFAYTESVKDEFEKVVVYEATDTPHTFYLFYTAFPPDQYQRIPNDEKRDLFKDNKKVVTLNEYDFNPGECPDHQEIMHNTLYVFKYGCLNDSQLLTRVTILTTISGPDNMPIFSIVQRKNLEELD